MVGYFTGLLWQIPDFFVAFSARMMNTLERRFGGINKNFLWFIETKAPFSGASLEKKGAGSYEDPALVDGCDRLLNRRGLNGRSGQTLPGQATSPAVFRDVTHRGVERSEEHTSELQTR